MGCQSNGQEEYVKLGDMEDGAAEYRWGEGHMVRWYASTSRTCQVDRIVPEPWFPQENKKNQWAFEACDPPPCRNTGQHDSLRAARLRTTEDLETVPEQWNSERCWGANITVDLVQLSEVAAMDGGPPTGVDAGSSLEAPLDLHAYVGLLFWAKASPSTRNRIQVSVRDSNSDPRGVPGDPPVCKVPTDGGAKVESPEKCYNDFSTFLDLTPSFAPYRVDFPDLWRDPTWGAKPTPYAPELMHVYQIAFQVNAPKCVADENAICASDDIPLGFDVWIDDLYLVKPK
jgi:hypothetical protein